MFSVFEKIKDKQKFDVNEIIRGSVQIFNPVFLDIAKFIDEKFGSNLKNWTEKDLKDPKKFLASIEIPDDLSGLI